MPEWSTTPRTVLRVGSGTVSMTLRNIQIFRCPYRSAVIVPPQPKLDVAWLGHTGLLDPAHPQIGMPC